MAKARLPVVLMVDDDPLFLAGQVRRHLAAGVEWELRVTTRPREIPTLLASIRPAVLITDLFMPDYEGLELIGEVVAVEPRTRVIAMSGGSAAVGVSYLEVACKLGAFASLSKPFEAEELFEMIRAGLVEHAAFSS